MSEEDRLLSPLISLFISLSRKSWTAVAVLADLAAAGVETTIGKNSAAQLYGVF